MTTALEVAEWMVKPFETARHVDQDSVVYKIKQQFGADFVYTNGNGNLAISRDVLKHFRKLTEGDVVWERSDRSWRKLSEGETYKGRLVE